jgi:peptidoglycan/xylan/chitin deacetylase (PgdA/CDA1 family)
VKWFNQTVFILKKLYPKRVWNIPDNNKILYLTFDDGPIPEVTPWVLQQLKQYHAKATFFCIGDNMKKNSKVLAQILKDGHLLGNHTFNHLNGWHTNTEDYLTNIEKWEQLGYSSSLFRPPYGKCKSSQAKEILKRGYSIIMWDVISEDYDQKISAEKCLHTVTSQAKSGSIIIFHDSLKAEKNLRLVLPKVLSYYANKGFVFKSLPANVAALKQ